MLCWSSTGEAPEVLENCGKTTNICKLQFLKDVKEGEKKNEFSKVMEAQQGLEVSGSSWTEPATVDQTQWARFYSATFLNYLLLRFPVNHLIDSILGSSCFYSAFKSIVIRRARRPRRPASQGMNNRASPSLWAVSFAACSSLLRIPCSTYECR